jgi:hypothetical protein
VGDGGELDIESGGALKIAGTDITSATADAVSGVASGYKLARGTAAFDTAATATIDTGLTTVVAFVASLRKATGLDSGTAFVTHGAPSGADVTVYAWVAAGTANGSADDTVDWVAVGT